MIDIGGKREHARRRVGLWAWVCAVVLYFAWEATSYRGLFASVAEWQFYHLGQDLPTFTFGVLTFLFASPALILFRRRREGVEAGGEVVPGSAQAAALESAIARQDHEAAIDAARDYVHFLLGFTTALTLAMLTALAWTLTLPHLEGPSHQVSPAATSAPNGPARLTGAVTYGRIASFSRGLLFLRHHELYAPILPADGRQGEVRMFVEFAPSERADIRSGATLAHRTGILMRGDLAGPMVRLYRYLGYRVATPYYVLYASAATIRWPYELVAIQFALGAIGFLLAALWQRRHVGRLVRLYEDEYVLKGIVLAGPASAAALRADRKRHRRR